MKPDLSQWHSAAYEALAVLRLMRERLEMNNYGGEEDQFLADCDIAIAMLETLPINREAAFMHVWPLAISEMIDEQAAKL